MSVDGISLGSAFLRLYGDRSALDRELEKLKRYTDLLEKQGIKVKFDADTGKASREIDGLQQRLNQLQQTLGQVSDGVRGDGDAWKNLAESLSGMAGKAAQSGGAMGKMAGMLGTAGAAASKAIPILGQLGMAAMGVQAIFQGVTGAINGVLGPLANLSREAGRFNQQVAEASIFATNSFAVYGPDGKAIQGTANQMRALRGTISKEYKEIQKEVAQISGATADQIYEGFNIILQNVGSLGSAGEDLGNVRKLATRLAAGMNTLGVPGDQLRSEMYSLLTGDVQIYDKLGRDLYGPNASQQIKKLQAEGRYYEDLMSKLEKLYDGQKVLSESLTNVQSNFTDVFQTIGAEASQALERGLAKSLKAVLNPLDDLQGSFMGFARATNEFLEPIMRILGEIGGWFVSVGSAVASTLQVVMDVLALGANIIGSVLGPQLRAIGKVLTVVAKAFEYFAALISAVVRPITVFFRVIGDQANQDVDGAFQPIIDFMDKLISLAQKASQVIAKPFVEMAKARAWLRGKLSGKSDQQIKGEQDEIEAEFASSIGQSSVPILRSLQLQRPTQDLLNEISQRYGSGSQRQLTIAKETSQLVQDRLKNEITGLEQAVKLMQTQKGLQESMNQLADARRGIAMSRATFAVQVAGSPEARLAAEERKNELAARQEQERINERKALLGTERQLLQTQLQIQLKQQRIQQEQLKIQRFEIQIQRDKAERAARDVAQKINNAAPGSKEDKALREQWRQLGREIQLRDQQLAVMNRTVSLAFEAESGMRRTTAIEQQRLGIQGQILDVQGQAAGLTLQQQQTLSRLQRQEQELKNQLADQQRPRNDLVKAAEQELRAIQQQQKTQQGLQELERARLENRKAAADADVQAAERQLRAAQARDGASTGRDYLAAQIEAIAAGTQGYISEADATRRLYDAKGRQLALEQEMQRQQLQAQQDRERSEMRIAAIQLRITELQTINLQDELQFRRQQLGLQQQRDALSGFGSGAPAAPVLPPLAGGSGAAADATSRLLQAANSKLGLFAGQTERCADAIRELFKVAGIAIGTTKQAWDGLTSGPRLASSFFGAEIGQRINRQQDLRPGDLVGFERTYGNWGPGVQTHVGLYAGDGMMYDHSSSRGLVKRPVSTFQGKFMYGMRPNALAGAVAPAGQPPTSLGNDLLQNSTDLVRVESDLARIRREQIGLQTQEAQLTERQDLGASTLASSQAAQRAQLQADRLRAQLTAEVMNSFKGRLAVSVADAYATGMTGAIRGVFAAVRSGQSAGDAIRSAMEQMADQLLESILSAALKPMQDAIYNNIFGGILGGDLKAVEQQVIAQQQTAAQGLTGAGQSLQLASQGLQSAAQALVGAASGAAASTAAAGGSAGGLTWPAIPTEAEVNGEVPNAPQQKEQGKLVKDLNRGFSAVTQAAVGVTLAFEGLKRVTEGGGTYETLMGLSSIFMGIGSVFSGIGALGKKASGGPVASGIPYLVGEQGPELFIPGVNGSILPNGQTAALAASRGALDGKSSAGAAVVFEANRDALSASASLSRERYVERVLSSGASSAEIKYSRVGSGDLPFVTEDDMLQATRLAAQEGARLGQQRTLAALRNNPATRRSVGV